MNQINDGPAILVINSLPHDIFSDHLLSRGYKVERLSLQSAIQAKALTSYRVVLVANSPDSDVVRILEYLKDKEKDSWPILASCSGGRQDFQPCLSVWYGHYDRDYFSFKSWAEFEKLLINKQARLKKQLVFAQDMTGGLSRYAINNYRFDQEVVSSNFNESINIVDYLSKEYLKYLNKWLSEVKDITFYVNFALDAKKPLKTLFLEPDRREHEGLPLFKEGDRITFKGDEEFIFASIKLVEDEQVVIVLDEKISAKAINQLKSYTISPSTGANMIDVYLGYLMLNPYLERPYYELMDNDNEVPLDFISGVSQKNFHPGRIYQAETDPGIILDKKTEKILRDASQVEALLDIMSAKFFSIMQGPAGTGKTFVCAVATNQFFWQGKSVLLLSHSNKGVDNLLEEVAKYIPYSHLFRFGNDINMMSPRAIKLNTREHYMDFKLIADRDDSPVVMATTLNSLVSNKEAHALANKADIVFIDEATRSLFYEVLPAIYKAKEKVILIGDEKQLGNIAFPPPVMKVLTRALENYGLLPEEIIQSLKDFNGGLFLQMQRFLSTKSLKCNRRSLPNICELVSASFYDGQLEVGRFNPYTEGELSFYDTPGKFPDERIRTSYRNPLEANFLIKKFLELVRAHIRAGGKITDLAIIAPYLAQINLIKSRLRKHLLFDRTIKAQVNEENIDEILNEIVVTVDAMQGSERKIIFLSATRSNAEGTIGFNKDIRRLNVALSRPQETLIIIGDASTFLRSNEEVIVKAFTKIVEIVKAKGKYQII